MPNDSSRSPSEGLHVLVAGDVCLDVVGVPEHPRRSDGAVDNWRLTGETRTHYLAGGALLLAEWVQAAAPAGATVHGPRPCWPAALRQSGHTEEQPLDADGFRRLAERLTRDEVVHSLLSVERFRTSPDAKQADTLRVHRARGFSGPKNGEPNLRILPPEPPSAPRLVVLDDTGNQFRRRPDQWPACIRTPLSARPILVYKLHRPLPRAADHQAGAADLWATAEESYPDNRVVIASIDDIRERVPISIGLSWERTALDLVWHLLNVPVFAPLRACPHLIVRLGLDGAVYWRGPRPGKPECDAWLVYDPAGIEGTAAQDCEGRMVGYGSAFTAALVGQLAQFSPDQFTTPSRDEGDALRQIIVQGTEAGLRACRRLLRIGFEQRKDDSLVYPAERLFEPTGPADRFLACQPVPIIPNADVPDRGYWRLLDSIFQNQTASLHRAVALTATAARPSSPDDERAADLLQRVPIAVFAKALRAYDRREIENYRALFALLRDYVLLPTPPRPLSVAVFGPPGAGKSFGVKKVAEALVELCASRPIKTLTFNLSQYQSPDQLGDAFHLIRDLVLRGNIPLVFFDEFDTALGDVQLGWLRYFLGPMQDAEFLDRGTPHPIGQSIFVFAGGTSSTYTDFAKPWIETDKDPDTFRKFKAAKGPDFLSRLRGTLDIPGLDLDAPFDAYGPAEELPCEAAILLRRAGILAHQLGEKAPHLRDSSNALRVSPAVLRALLHLPHFEHGNRSFEALLDMSHLPGASVFNPALLPSSGHIGLHANPSHLSQLLGTDYPFPPADRTEIAKRIHSHYLERRKAKSQSHS